MKLRNFGYLSLESTSIPTASCPWVITVKDKGQGANGAPGPALGTFSGHRSEGRKPRSAVVEENRVSFEGLS